MISNHNLHLTQSIQTATHYKKGLRLQLKAKESKNITVGSPIYYKGFEVGEIYDADLINEGDAISF